jgi:S-adenosylmethionine-diacylgycerolhomoserine-N-methlytransferase
MAVFMSMSAAPSPEASPSSGSRETSHAGLMDQVYRYQRYLYDFTRKYYLFGRDSLIADLALAPGDRLVEIGCGTARNLIAIARAYPQARLFGLDASAAMLETAQAQIERAGLQARIRLAHGLAEDLTPALFGENNFDDAVFSYSLSMIPDWRRALAAGMACLSPQGRVHIVDFGDFQTLPGRGALRAWLRRFHVTPRTQLLAKLENSDPKVRQNGRLTLLPGRYAFRYSGGKM